MNSIVEFQSYIRLTCFLCTFCYFYNVPLCSQTWQSVGPHMLPSNDGIGSARGLGRINVIRFHPGYNGTSNKILYAGSYLGGAWKTSNGGESWTNMNTDSLPVMAVSDITVRPDAPDTIYLATGDPGLAFDRR